MPDVEVVVFEPRENPAESPVNLSTDVPPMTPGKAALVGLMDRYLAGLMDPFVSLLEVHKLMYFLQVAGESLKLRYVKAPYGPYAENLRHVLKAIEGHLISGYGEGGDQPEKPLSLVPGAVKDAEAFLSEHPTTLTHFERVTHLTEGFETPFGLELLSTVHWVINQEKAQDPEAIINTVYDWGAQKRQFTPAQITLAAAHLQAEGWLDANLVKTNV